MAATNGMIVMKIHGIRRMTKEIKITTPGIKTIVIMALKIESISEEITIMGDPAEKNHETQNPEMIVIATAEMKLMRRNMNRIS